LRFKAINSRKGRQPGRCPFQIGSGMDAKTRNLALLVGLSLLCAGVAGILSYFVLSWIFIAFGAVAAVGIAERHWL
jgi:hypothetical protein